MSNQDEYRFRKKKYYLENISGGTKSGSNRTKQSHEQLVESSILGLQTFFNSIVLTDLQLQMARYLTNTRFINETIIAFSKGIMADFVYYDPRQNDYPLLNKYIQRCNDIIINLNTLLQSLGNNVLILVVGDSPYKVWLTIKNDIDLINNKECVYALSGVQFNIDINSFMNDMLRKNDIDTRKFSYRNIIFFDYIGPTARGLTQTTQYFNRKYPSVRVHPFNIEGYLMKEPQDHIFVSRYLFSDWGNRCQPKIYADKKPVRLTNNEMVKCDIVLFGIYLYRNNKEALIANSKIYFDQYPIVNIEETHQNLCKIEYFDWDKERVVKEDKYCVNIITDPHDTYETSEYDILPVTHAIKMFDIPAEIGKFKYLAEQNIISISEIRESKYRFRDFYTYYRYKLLCEITTNTGEIYTGVVDDRNSIFIETYCFVDGKVSSTKMFYYVIDDIKEVDITEATEIFFIYYPDKFWDRYKSKYITADDKLRLFNRIMNVIDKNEERMLHFFIEFINEDILDRSLYPDHDSIVKLRLTYIREDNIFNHEIYKKYDQRDGREYAFSYYSTTDSKEILYFPKGILYVLEMI